MKIENKDFTAKSLIGKISNPTKRKTVGELFLERIQELKNNQRTEYALSHEYVYKALIKFNGHLDIYFSEIDIDWLKNFEEWQHHQGASLNTIGIRFRTLRAIYNLAIQKKYVKAEYYPFQNYNVSKLHEITPKRALSKNAIQFKISGHNRIFQPFCLYLPKSLLYIYMEARQEIKNNLLEKLKQEHCFWSFNVASIKDVPDDILIEKTLIYLDIEEINQLFLIYPFQKIKQVWREEMVPQGQYLYTLNRFLAWYYFKIKHPDSYLKAMQTKHLNKIIQ